MMVSELDIPKDFIRYLMGKGHIDTYHAAEKVIWGRLHSHGAVILRCKGNSFPVDVFFRRKGLRRFIDNLDRDSVKLTVSPRSLNIAESTNAGFFHNDYTIHGGQPEYVCIRCIKSDPRHPYYGRNQIALVDKIVMKLTEVAPAALVKLRTIPLPCKILDHKFDVIPLSTAANGRNISRIHIGYVNKEELNGDHLYEGIRIHELLEIIALDVCDEFVLDPGDICVVSNKYCMHRRGACSVKFVSGVNMWQSRVIDTTRYIY